MVMEGTVKNTYVRANIIYFAAVSKPNDCIFPYDFKEEIKKKVIPFGWYCLLKYERCVDLGELCKRNVKRSGMIISLVFHSTNLNLGIYFVLL